MSWIICNDFVFKAHYAYAVVIEKSCSFFIIVKSGLSVMTVSVKLDSKFYRWAVEIENISADAVLPAKF